MSVTSNKCAIIMSNHLTYEFDKIHKQFLI